MSEEQSMPAVAEGGDVVAGGAKGDTAAPTTSAAPSLPPPSKLPSLKPSGIKPPSKIGRLCDGNPKVAPLPPTPTQIRPVCRPGQQEKWLVARGETINITCDLEANPDAVTFYWRLNHSADSRTFAASDHVDERARSFLQITPKTDQDYGTLECWGANSQGRQDKPCIFTLITAAKPETPFNCTILNQSAHSLTAGCSNAIDGHRRSDSSGHSPHYYQVVLTDIKTRFLVRNFSSQSSIFRMDDLSPNQEFKIDIHAVNNRGASEPFTLVSFTLKGPERQTGGSPASVALTPLLGAVGGAFSALVLAAILIVLAVRARTRRAALAAANRDARKTAAAVTATANNGETDKDEDDNNPDLIPGKGDVEVVDPDEKAFEYLTDRRLYTRRSIGQWGCQPPSLWGNSPMPAMSTMPDNTTVTYAALDGTLPRLPLRVSHPMSTSVLAGSPTSPMTSSTTTVPSVAGVLSGSLSGGVGPGSLATLRRTQPLRDATVYTQIGCMPDQVRQSISSPPMLSPAIPQLGGGMNAVGTLGVVPPPSVTATRF